MPRAAKYLQATLMLKIPQSWQRALRWKADHDMAPIAVLVRDAIRPMIEETQKRMKAAENRTD